MVAAPMAPAVVSLERMSLRKAPHRELPAASLGRIVFDRDGEAKPVEQIATEYQEAIRDGQARQTAPLPVSTCRRRQWAAIGDRHSPTEDVEEMSSIRERALPRSRRPAAGQVLPRLAVAAPPRAD